jgi:hypothetical protein
MQAPREAIFRRGAFKYIYGIPFHGQQMQEKGLTNDVPRGEAGPEGLECIARYHTKLQFKR